MAVLQFSRRGKPRGRPFAKGNSGRPKGARNKKTVALEALFEASGPEIVEKAIALALDGDRSAMALCLDRLVAPRRERTVKFEFPDIRKPEDLVPAVSAVAKAVADGTLTPGEGAQIAELIEKMCHAVEVQDFGERLAALEKFDYIVHAKR